MRFFVAVILLTFTESQRDKIDTKHCKVTHNGIEYEGSISQTESGLLCKYWMLDSSLRESDFVDGNKSLKTNHCRNVKAKFENPWCYTTDPNVAEEICDVRLCNSNCKGTGAGSEYGGDVNETYSGRTCLMWSEKIYRKYLNKKQIMTSERVLLDRKFPEMSRKRAQNFCRNPTGDSKGPWCLVEDLFDGKVQYEKEYCDVTFCEETNCTFGTNGFYGDDYHTHFFSLRNRTTISLDLQLWNVDLNNYSFRISFNSHPLPLSGENLFAARNGIEVLITNEGFGYATPVDEDEDGEQHKSVDWYSESHILSGVKRRNIEVSWLPEFSQISTKISGLKPLKNLYIVEDDQKKTILGLRNGSLVYASISGNGGLWNLPCDDCEHIVTIAPRCNVHRKMKKKILFSYIAEFYVRSTETVIIELRESPIIMYPFLRIEIFGSWNKTTMMYVSSNNSVPEYLSTKGYENIISYWKWSQFQISTIRDHLKLEWIKNNVPTETIIDIDHSLVNNAKWYSVCSKSMAHWMFNCLPDELIELPERKPPNCVKTKSAEEYKGNQSITENGQPCFPWIFKGVDNELTKMNLSLSEQKKKLIRNHCINLNSDPFGAYCYVADTQELPKLKMKKEYCNIPLCLASECKMSGIGKEYDGGLNTTRLNRTCLFWEKSNITEVSNNRTANLTLNYCRNPTYNTFGPWCFTTDPRVPIDLCNVPDCLANDACTMITYDFKRTRKFLLKPEWVSYKLFFKVKVWNPSFDKGISIHLIYSEIFQYFSLDIGANNNGTIELKFHFKNGTSVSLKKKSIPNIIPFGYWQGFWLRVPPNKIEFGYDDSEVSIFDWVIPSDSDIPYKMAKYFSLVSLGEYNVGFNFPCSYCLISIVAAPLENAFYPINLWSDANSLNDTLTLHLRAKESSNPFGVTIIHFYGSNETNFIRILIFSQIIRVTTENVSEILAHEEFKVKILRESQWTTFKIHFNQSHFKMSADFRTLLQFNTVGKRVLQFYYFTIAAMQTITTWLANCNAPALDNNPINGGWSEWSSWTCNAACGGGIGYRRRYCNNPAPNLIGDPCIGSDQEDGECNKFECGCIDPDTIEKAISSLYVNSFNQAVKAGVDVTFRCEKNLTKIIQRDSPTSYIEWLKDGYKISKTSQKLEKLNLNKTDLILHNVQESDSGVYMCIINPECKPANNLTFLTMKIIALTVIDETEHVIRETTPLELTCRGLTLSFIYTELSQSWKLNDELYIDFTTTALEDDEIYVFEEAEKSQTGRWHCRIRQRKLNLTWFTNTFRVKVIDPPTIYTYLSEEDAPSVIFYHWNYYLIILFLWTVIILEASAVIYIVYWYWKSRKELLGE